MLALTLAALIAAPPADSMPINGIGRDALHLAADGTLSPLRAGFALRVTHGEQRETRALDATGFPDVAFRDEFPIGIVRYRSDDLPVDVELHAFSPFSPTDLEDSSAAVTYFRFVVSNTGATMATVELAGWLENDGGSDRNRIVRGGNDVRLEAGPTLALMVGDGRSVATASIADTSPDTIFDALGRRAVDEAMGPGDRRPVGAVGRRVRLAPGAAATATFIIAFDGTADFAVEHDSRLTALTRAWRDAWYGSTLPRDLLERVMGSAARLTSPSWRDTEALVLFPALARTVDDPDLILHVHRTHRVSADATYLERLWPRVRDAVARRFGSEGPRAWAEIAAGAAMARDMGDDDFAAKAERSLPRGPGALPARDPFGEYLAACGLQFHGPRGHFGFAPRHTPDDFRAAFTAAEGWGLMTQHRVGTRQKNTIAVLRGTMRVRTLAFEFADGATPPATAEVRYGGDLLETTDAVDDRRVLITLTEPLDVRAGRVLEVRLSTAPTTGSPE